VLGTIEQVRQGLHPTLRSLVLPTFYDRRKVADREALQALRDAFPIVEDVVVPERQAFVESSIAHAPLVRFAPESDGAAAYPAPRARSPPDARGGAASRARAPPWEGGPDPPWEKLARLPPRRHDAAGHRARRRGGDRQDHRDDHPRRGPLPRGRADAPPARGG